MSAPFASADFIIDDFNTSGTGTVTVTPNNAERTANPSLNGNPGGSASLAIGGGDLSVTNAANNQGFLAEYAFVTPKNFFDITNIIRVVFDADATDDGSFDVSLQAFSTGTGTSTVKKTFVDRKSVV